MKLEEGKKQIKKLLDAIKDTDIDEIYYEENGFKVGFKTCPSAAEQIEETQEESKKEESALKTIDIFSNSVGLFRDCIPPSRKVFARVGQKVNKGQKLGFIESMKIMKDISSPVKGTIIEKYVKQSDPVEYGKILFKIEQD